MNQAIKKFGESIDKKFRDSQNRVWSVINLNVVMCFYDLGRRISDHHSKFIDQADYFKCLSDELVSTTGQQLIFSVDSLKLFEKFYNLYQQYYSKFPFDYEKAMNGYFIPESFDHIISLPWSLNELIVKKCSDVEEAFFYVEEAYFGKWTKKQLIENLEKNSYKDPNYIVNTEGRSLFDLLTGKNRPTFRKDSMSKEIKGFFTLEKERI